MNVSGKKRGKGGSALGHRALGVRGRWEGESRRILTRQGGFVTLNISNERGGGPFNEGGK